MFDRCSVDVRSMFSRFPIDVRLLFDRCSINADIEFGVACVGNADADVQLGRGAPSSLSVSRN